MKTEKNGQKNKKEKHQLRKRILYQTNGNNITTKKKRSATLNARGPQLLSQGAPFLFRCLFPLDEQNTQRSRYFIVPFLPAKRGNGTTGTRTPNYNAHVTQTVVLVSFNAVPNVATASLNTQNDFMAYAKTQKQKKRSTAREHCDVTSLFDHFWLCLKKKVLFPEYKK